MLEKSEDARNGEGAELLIMRSCLNILKSIAVELEGASTKGL